MRTCILLIMLTLTGGQVEHIMAPGDIHAIKDVADPQISPDGKSIICAVTETLGDRSSAVTHLWLLSVAGGTPRRLTEQAGGSNARWAPDGKSFAYYANRGGQSGLWIMPIAGGEPSFIAAILRTNFHLKGAGESFAWAPDSKRIAYLTSPESAPSATAAIGDNPAFGSIPERLRRPLSREEIDRLPPATREMILRAQGAPAATNSTPGPQTAVADRPPAVDDPRVITRLRYKSRTSFTDSLQSHIFIIDLQTQKIRQLTGGAYYEHSLSWSPKGDEIAFVSNHEPEPDRVNNSDIFVANVTTGTIRQLTQTKGCEWAPAFSPDGSELLFLGTTREVTTIDSVAEDTKVFVLALRGGAARNLSSELDRRAIAARWVADGRSILFTAGDQGKTLLFQVARSGGKSVPLYDTPSQTGGFSISTGSTLAFTMADARNPAEVFVNSASAKPTRVSSFNDDSLKLLKLSDVEEFRFPSEGAQVQAFLVPPVRFDPLGKYPVILSIHGGPHGMSGYSFNAQAQILAGKGYAVLFINPRGSSGYGQKFSDGCVNDWGGGDYRDLMTGVDAALKRFPFLDGARMGVMGGSYGGYMTNWVVTQTPRFRAGVASASLANLVSFYSTSLYQDLIHAEFNGFPWDNFEKLWQRSPLAHIKQAKTPLLLLHGESDNDVHITQAEEMYTALRMQGVESVLVRYPREGHSSREPRHREDQMARTLDWFEQRLK